MKKLLLTTVAIACSASAVANASNAILNVEGEIQVNGQTVIDNTGQWVGPTVTPSLINLADYQANSEKTVALERTETYFDHDSQTNVTDTYRFEFEYGANGVSISETEYRNDVKTWGVVWSDRTDTSFKTVTYNGCNYSRDFEIIATTGFPAVPLGYTTTRADILDYTVTASDCSSLEVGTKGHSKDIVTLDIGAQFDYTFGEQTLPNCLLVRQSVTWSDTSRTMVYCEDYGIVEMGDYKLKEIL